MAPAVLEVFRGLVSARLSWPLFLHGPAGTGKTSAALALLDYVAGEGFFYTANGLADEQIEASKGVLSWHREGLSGTLTLDMLRRQLGRADLVVVDELATRERVNDWPYQCLLDLLDRRRALPLIVMGNHDLSTVERIYDDRIASRLAAGTVLHLQGRDRRLPETKGKT